MDWLSGRHKYRWENEDEVEDSGIKRNPLHQFINIYSQSHFRLKRAKGLNNRKIFK